MADEFQVAISGLNAAAADLKVTGNNIANSNTTGFKESIAQFADVFTANAGSVSANATGEGVRLSRVVQQFGQGGLDITDNNFDLAVSGKGFFNLQDTDGSSVVTRAGSFTVNSAGTVVNNLGQELQVFPPVGNSNVNFNTGALNSLTISTADDPPSATTTANIGSNLNANDAAIAVAFNSADAATFNDSTSLSVFDSLGIAHTATFFFAKTAANNFTLHTTVGGNAPAVAAEEAQALVFNTSGTIVTPAGGTLAPITITAAQLGTGAADLTFTLDVSNLTQFGTDFAVNQLSQNGFTTGQLNSVDVDNDGVVFARFTNGQSDALGKVALTSFANEQGLTKEGNSNWSESTDSGVAIDGEAGTGNFGLIQSGALENSNVDISQELVNLILAQRNFQANSKVIQTADAITQTIINIR